MQYELVNQKILSVACGYCKRQAYAAGPDGDGLHRVSGCQTAHLHGLITAIEAHGINRSAHARTSRFRHRPGVAGTRTTNQPAGFAPASNRVARSGAASGPRHAGFGLARPLPRAALTQPSPPDPPGFALHPQPPANWHPCLGLSQHGQAQCESVSHRQNALARGPNLRGPNRPEEHRAQARDATSLLPPAQARAAIAKAHPIAGDVESRPGERARATTNWAPAGWARCAR